MTRVALAFPPPPCHKRRFSSRQEALEHLRELSRDWRGTLRYLLSHPAAQPHAYRCPNCPRGTWHLTGEPDNGKPQGGARQS